MPGELPSWIEERKWYAEGIIVEVLAVFEYQTHVTWATEAGVTSEKMAPHFKDLPEEEKEKYRSLGKKALSITFGNYDQVLKEEV